MISGLGFVRSRRAMLLAAVAALPLMLPAPLQAQAPAVTAPAAVATLPVFADLAERLIDAVVNISTARTITLGPADLPFQLGPEGNLPEGLGDLFGDNGAPMQQVQGVGSGFVIDASGIIVTNNHVIDEAEEIWATFHDGTRLAATLVGVDPLNDIAVLRVNPPRPLVAVSFGNSEMVRVGDWVMAIGNPFGLGGTVTAGILSARNRDLRAGPFDNFLQTDTAINQGNSGGPLFNLAGDVIGINTAIYSQSGANAGVAFAVPSETASRVVAQILEFGRPRRGQIGVRIQDVTPGIAEAFGITATRGALVAEVFEGTPAEAAGIRTGDIILSINGRIVDEMRDLPRFVSETDVGATVPVVVLRDGAEQTISVRIAEVAANQPAVAVVGDPVPEPAPLPEMSAQALGLTLAPITPELRSEFEIVPALTEGVVVTAVTPSSLAAERGFQPGDIILRVGTTSDQAPITTAEDVDARLVAEVAAGRTVALLFVATPDGDTRFEWVRLQP
ncbi:MAG: Do family serine endopeptidase [Bauldia sp.]|nr:Do family serine endopeptidase [Bauldia sp.]